MNVRTILRLVATVAVLSVVIAGKGWSQVTTGTPPFTNLSGGPFDSIDPANLNIHLAIPVFARPGAGLPFSYALGYDSSVWFPSSGAWVNVGNWGWRGLTEAAVGYISYRTNVYKCWSEDGLTWGLVNRYSNYVYHDAFGTPHPFSLGPLSACWSDPIEATAVASNGSGYYIDARTANATVWDRSGTTIHAPMQVPTGTGSRVDTNGNTVSTTGTSYTDTLGSTALTISGTAPNPVSYTYTAPGGPAPYVVTYTPKTVKTNFGCSGVAEFGPTTVALVTRVALPDGSHYDFTYEPTPGYSGDFTGRIASVSLPTGGIISYTYTGSNNGIVCADGSTAGIQRTTPDTGTGHWSYSRSGAGTAWTTTVTDPGGNETVLNFQGLYETERQAYQGAHAGGTLLETVYTCYNGLTAPCNSNTITGPITQRTVTLQWPGTGGLKSKTDAYYNNRGLPTEVDQYGYAATNPALIRKTLTTYASLGATIADRPATVKIQDSTGTTVAETDYGYDTHGNATSISLVTTGDPLSRSFTYNSNGTVASSTDVNTALTTYAYGAESCNGAFPTSVSEPLSLSRSMTWNCAGGVLTSITDENGQVTSSSYTDANFWRPHSLTDQASNQTTYTYTTTSVDSAMLFNASASIVENLTNFDTSGRPHISQRRQGPSATNYDSVETDYDSLGRPYRSTLPYSASANGGNTSGPWSATTTFDALGRPTQVQDSTSPTHGTVVLTYTQNDVLQVVSPPPSGENTKQKQLEYDALGRLTSVCELTSTQNGGGSCGQTSSVTGYWTRYTYDVLGDLLTVSQNAQSASPQPRTYTYDGLGRMLTEANPETGTINYTYDYDSACSTQHYKGDLVKRVDAVGNTTCYAYDALHRVTAITYPSGSCASVTPEKHFVYDSATVNGNTMANAVGRLAEAYTGPSNNKTTDLGYSYAARGEVADVYQKTPNSGGYYHLTASYWANGAVYTLAGLGLPTFTYGVDGEGRPKAVTANSGTNPIPSATPVSYNVGGQVLGLTFGSGDSDSFGYDSNTGRMSQYQYNIGATPQTVTGALTWNANGTLRQLAITDQLNSNNTQTCTYGYDDLVRITSANCGSVWSQTLGFDPFGNLSKSGSVSFQPTYNTTTNRVTTVGGQSFSYDANGNTLNDTFRAYAWDAEGRATTVGSVTATYDALGRMVEQNGATQIVYAPTGQKFALMSGQTVSKAFVPLPAGAQAVYSGTTLTYFRHPDWLGSARFTSTTGRTMYSDASYAPFGEPYPSATAIDPSFTGQNQDTIPGNAAGLYDFLYREYGLYGRWISPDPAGMASVDLSNPQSLNRYAYATNNPLNAINPLGLDAADPILCELFGMCGGGGGGGWGGAASWGQTTLDGYMVGGGFGPAATDVFREGLYNYLFSMQTGGLLPSQCRTGYDGQMWCGSGDWEFGNWTAVGSVNIENNSVPIEHGPRLLLTGGAGMGGSSSGPGGIRRGRLTANKPSPTITETQCGGIYLLRVGRTCVYAPSCGIENIQIAFVYYSQMAAACGVSISSIKGCPTPPKGIQWFTDSPGYGFDALVTRTNVQCP